MKNKYASFILICMVSAFSTSFAQQVINLGIGPTWPKGLRETEKPTAWNASVEYGRIFDKIVGFGVDFDFAWNVSYKDSTIYLPNDTITRKLSDNKFFMFPISAFLFFDPIPKYPLHPVVRAQIGVNMAARSYEELDKTGDVIESPKNGFYIGILGKAGADAVYDLGEHAAIYAGFEFQWGKLRRKVKDAEKDFYYFDFYGPCIRMGLSFLF